MPHTLSISSAAVPVFMGAPALGPVRLSGREGLKVDHVPAHPPGKVRLQWWQLAIAALLLALISACMPEPMTAGITGYNFTREGVQGYSVNDMYGSNLPPYGGGGSVSCCVLLPPQWTPELKATVRWTMGRWTTPYESRKHLPIGEQIRCCSSERTLTKTVPIEPYGEGGGRLQVFFLPDDEIKVYVSNYGLGHEKHPSGLAYPENPNPLPTVTE